MILRPISFRKLSITFLFFALAGTVGCDQISSLMGKKEAPKAVVPAAAPVVAAQPAAVETDTALAPDMLARVGKWSISVDEFNEKLKKLKDILPEFDPTNARSKRLILEEMVRQELLVMDAEETGVAARKDIQDTVEDFRKTLLVQEVATELAKGIEATEADAREYYDKNQKEFVVTPEWKVREIVVPTEGEAKDILVLLLQGADFAETAIAKSKASTAPKGGDKGFVSKFPFEQMQSAISPLEVGKVSGVFKGPEGYYIVKLDEKKGGEPRPFASIKNELVKGLTLKKQQEAVLEHLNALAAKVKIQVNEDLLK